MNLCRACNRDFSSCEGFDEHRVGVHTYTYDEGLALDTPRDDGRRCLDHAEMVSRGWMLDRHGRLVHPREARKRLRRGGDSLLGTFPTLTRIEETPGSLEALSEPITAARKPADPTLARGAS